MSDFEVGGYFKKPKKSKDDDSTSKKQKQDFSTQEEKTKQDAKELPQERIAEYEIESSPALKSESDLQETKILYHGKSKIESEDSPLRKIKEHEPEKLPSKPKYKYDSKDSDNLNQEKMRKPQPKSSSEEKIKEDELMDLPFMQKHEKDSKDSDNQEKMRKPQPKSSSEEKIKEDELIDLPFMQKHEKDSKDSDNQEKMRKPQPKSLTKTTQNESKEKELKKPMPKEKEDNSNNSIPKERSVQIPENNLELNPKVCIYSGYVYDPKDVCCQICGAKIDPENDKTDSFVHVVPNFFLCQEDYHKCETDEKVLNGIKQPLREAFIKSFVKYFFEPSELTPDAIPIHIPCDVFLPTIQFHCKGELENIKCDELENRLGENILIYEVERGSSLFKAALLYDIKRADFQRSSDEFKSKMMPFYNEVKNKFIPAIGESLVGEHLDQPRLNMPNRKDADEYIKKKHPNLLQNFAELEEMEFDQILQDLLNLTRDLRSKKYFRKIIQTKEIYDKAEKKINEDIRSNPYEMTLIKESVIVNKYDDDYNQKMNLVSEEKRKETFLYHGTSVKNQIGIIDKSFNVPGIDNVVHTYDDGYYGSGVYSTSNLFYAAYYAHNLKNLKVNETAYTLYCKAFYNKDKVKVYLVPEPGEMDNDIVSNYGINYAFVGSQNDYFPINEEDKDKHFVSAEEFVFGNKNQIIPIFSFEIMRRDFLILWKDDHIDNIENSSYMREMLKQGVNIYGAKNNEEAINIIKLKKRNKIKFITNCGPDMSGKKLIEKIRNEFHYNFICLVFTSRITHLNWVKNIPNVILTTDDFKFRDYVEMEMTQENVLNFIKDLEQTYHTKFNIKENELLKYPDFINDIDHPSPAEKEKLLHPQQQLDGTHISPPSQESETNRSSGFGCLIA